MSSSVTYRFGTGKAGAQVFNSMNTGVALNQLEQKFSEKTYYNSNMFTDAEVFLLGELHGTKRCNLTNGELISLLASRGKIALFLERFELFQEVVDEPTITDVMYRFHIDPKVRKQIRFFGWNVKMGAEIVKTLKDLAFLKNCMGIDKQTLEIANQARFRDQETQGWLCNIGQEEKMGFTLNAVEERLINNGRSAYQLNLLLKEQLKDIFPLQVQNMVTALQAAKQFGEKAVFLSGCGHLYEMNNAFNLQPLRNELERHRAVTLIPKDIETVENWSVEEIIALVKQGHIHFMYV